MSHKALVGAPPVALVGQRRDLVRRDIATEKVSTTTHENGQADLLLRLEHYLGRVPSPPVFFQNGAGGANGVGQVCVHGGRSNS